MKKIDDEWRVILTKAIAALTRIRAHDDPDLAMMGQYARICDCARDVIFWSEELEQRRGG